jgi:hypothetical protein
VIRANPAAKVTNVEIGDDVGGWKVAQIEGQKLVLALDGRLATFVMFSRTNVTNTAGNANTSGNTNTSANANAAPVAAAPAPAERPPEPPQSNSRSPPPAKTRRVRQPT